MNSHTKPPFLYPPPYILKIIDIPPPEASLGGGISPSKIKILHSTSVRTLKRHNALPIAEPHSHWVRPAPRCGADHQAPRLHAGESEKGWRGTPLLPELKYNIQPTAYRFYTRIELVWNVSGIRIPILYTSHMRTNDSHRHIRTHFVLYKMNRIMPFSERERER